MKTEPLTFKDFKAAIICFVIGGVLAFGILCLIMGLFYNSELVSIADSIDGIER